MEKNEISEIIESLVIVPDTSVLLYLYKCSFNTSKNIVGLLDKVKEKVLIPSRVYKEYEKNKNKQESIIDKKYDNFTKNLKSEVDKLKCSVGKRVSEQRKYDFPDCDSLETKIYGHLDSAIQEIATYERNLSPEKQNKEAQKNGINQMIQFWVNQGNVLEDLTIIQLLDYVREGEIRFKYKMPPGYEDEKEKDVKSDDKTARFEARIRKFGDLFIWKEILKIGKELADGKKVLFIVNDVKEDWWELRGEQDNKEPVCIRDELKQEYLAVTGNSNIEFMTLSGFYELFSDYYKICDIKTTLELNSQVYVHERVHAEYEDTIYSEFFDRVSGIEWDEVSPEFLFIEMPEVEIEDELKINEVNLHYDDEGETAFYDVDISVMTNTVYILQKDSKILIAGVDLELHLLCQIKRGLRDLDKEDFYIKTFSYKVHSYRDAWELYLEADEDARAEAAEAMEEFYYH